MRAYKAIALGTFALAFQINVLAANPKDLGTTGYLTRIYVDNTSTCVGTDCGKSWDKPMKNLSDALANVLPGTELIIAGTGVPYYSTVDGFPPSNKIVRRSVLSFPKLNSGATQAGTLVRAWNGISTMPVIRGTYKINGWQAVANAPANTYVRTWDLQSEAAGYDSSGVNFKIVEPQQVYWGNTALQQVGGHVFGGAPFPPGTVNDITNEEKNLGQSIWPKRVPEVGSTPWTSLQANQFYYDGANKKIYVRLASPLPFPISSSVLEVSVHMHLATGAPYPNSIFKLTLSKLAFERSNTSSFARGGALFFIGQNIKLDQLLVQDADAACVQLSGHYNQLTNSTVQRCGQLGITGNGSFFTLSNNTVVGNNTRGFNQDWEAGGMKFIGGAELPVMQVNGAPKSIDGLDDSTISKNALYLNNGHGIWLDTSAHHNTVSENISAYNNIGIFLEIGDNNTVSQNQSFGNVSQGMQLKGSGNTVSSNLFVGNGGSGLVMPPDSRKILANDPGYAPFGNWIMGNKFAWNDQKVNKLEISVIGSNGSSSFPSASNAIQGNRYCGAYMQYQLSTLMNGSLQNQYTDNFNNWNQMLSQLNGAYDNGPPSALPFPSDLANQIANKDLSLIEKARSSQLMSSSGCSGF